MTVVCQATGQPPPELTYYKKENMSKRKTLHFSAIKHDDAGEYECVATNTYFDQESGQLQNSKRTADIYIEVYCELFAV